MTTYNTKCPGRNNCCSVYGSWNWNQYYHQMSASMQTCKANICSINAEHINVYTEIKHAKINAGRNKKTTIASINENGSNLKKKNHLDVASSIIVVFFSSIAGGISQIFFLFLFLCFASHFTRISMNEDCQAAYTR